MGLGQILSYATRRIKPNQIRIRKRELDASNNRSFASEFVSSEYDFTALVGAPQWPELKMAGKLNSGISLQENSQ